MWKVNIFARKDNLQSGLALSVMAAKACWVTNPGRPSSVIEEQSLSARCTNQIKHVSLRPARDRPVRACDTLQTGNTRGGNQDKTMIRNAILCPHCEKRSSDKFAKKRGEGWASGTARGGQTAWVTERIRKQKAGSHGAESLIDVSCSAGHSSGRKDFSLSCRWQSVSFVSANGLCPSSLKGRP